MGRRYLAYLAAGAMTLASAGVGLAQSGAGSAYDKLPPEPLANKLSAMGMTEILSQYVKELEGSGNGSVPIRAMAAEVKISQAIAEGVPLEDRNKLLDEAIAVLDKLAKETEKAKETADVMQHFRLTARLAEVAGLFRVEPYALRLQYLQGSPLDRKMILDVTKPIMASMEGLVSDIQMTVEDWRADAEKLVTVVPELDDLRLAVKYRASWARLYRGMALPDDQANMAERRRLLNAAMVDVESFARDTNDSGVKYWSLLLMGMAARENGLHEQALRMFKDASVAEAEAPVRVQAQFETARTLAESGQFDKAIKGVEDFRKNGVEILGKSGKLQVDVKAALLKHYTYEMQAAREKDKAQADKYAMSAKQALLAFLDEYTDPAVQASFYDIIAMKYRDRADYENLNSVILLAVAMQKAAQNTPEALAESAKMLETIAARQDDLAPRARPLALWELALAANRRRENVKATQLFAAVAKEYPDHPIARRAALNAVISQNGILQERVASNAVIDAKLRQGMIDALEVLLGKWGQDSEASKWYSELGWQYQRLADTVEESQAPALIAKAINAFEKVPAGTPEAMEGKYQSLQLRAQLARLNVKDNPKAAPEKLTEDLRQYAGEARKAASAAQDKRLAKSFAEWGGKAAFLRAELMYEQLDRQEPALQAAREVRKDWPGTEAVVLSQRFEIAKLIEQARQGKGQDKLDQAIGLVKTFSEEHPAEAEQLLAMIVSQLRERIMDLRMDVTKAQDLKSYQDVYMQFAQVLYDRARQENLPPDRLYGVKQMYASALLEQGKGAEALALFQETSAFERKRRDVEIAKVNAEFDAKVKALDAASRNSAALADRVKEFFDLLSDLGLRKNDMGVAIDVELAAAQLAAVPPEQDATAAQDQVVRYLKDGLKRLRQAKINAVPLDANNVHGLARAYRAVNQYDKSLELYHQIVAGINRQALPKLYWLTQLERAETTLAGYAKDAATMRKLATLIKQLQKDDPRMGGLFGRFGEIERQATELGAKGG